jgi:hypothetical protein
VQNRITLRMTDDMIARIDAWILTQTGFVSRQEAVRRLLGFSLDHVQQLPAIKQSAGRSQS